MGSGIGGIYYVGLTTRVEQSLSIVWYTYSQAAKAIGVVSFFLLQLEQFLRRGQVFSVGLNTLTLLPGIECKELVPG